MAIVTPTDRPKSVRKRCVIEVFGDVFVLSRCYLDFLCDCRDFCDKTESDIFLFLFEKYGFQRMYLIESKSGVFLSIY